VASILLWKYVELLSICCSYTLIEIVKEVKKAFWRLKRISSMPQHIHNEQLMRLSFKISNSHSWTRKGISGSQKGEKLFSRVYVVLSNKSLKRQLITLLHSLPYWISHLITITFFCLLYFPLWQLDALM
jgi:hypothetical protein